MMSCGVCDDTCKTCTGTSSFCTSCGSPLFLLSNMCIADCSSSISNYYGEPSTRACTKCPVNCLSCTSPTGCTACLNETNNATPIYNFAGVCVNTCPANSLTDTPNL